MREVKYPCFNMSPEWAGLDFTVEKAAQVERDRPSSPGLEDTFSGKPASVGGIPYEEIAWPGGSPTNYALMNHHMEGDFNDITPQLATEDQETFKSLFGSNSGEWDHWQGRSGFFYSKRDPATGRPHAVTEDEVLAAIGRSYGQEGA